MVAVYVVDLGGIVVIGGGCMGHVALLISAQMCCYRDVCICNLFASIITR